MENDDRFRLLVESIQDYAIYMLDCLGHVVTWNLGAQLNKGYTSQEIIGTHYKVFYPAEDIVAGVPERNLAEAARLGHYSGEGWRQRKGGQRFWAGFVITAMRDEAGRLIGFAKVTQDLTARKQSEEAIRTMEAALREERDSFRAATESSMDALYMCKALRNDQGEIEDFIFTYLNSNVEKMVALPRSRMLGGRMCDLIPENVTMGLFDQYCRVVATGEAMVQEFAVSSPNVTCGWIRVQAVKLHDGVAITASDITQRRQREAEIIHLAHHDPLTGLLNRSMLVDRIEQAIDRSLRYDKSVGVLMVDLDGFKQVNDMHGHLAGDQVLMAVAGRLEGAFRGTDSVIRIGGDEFVIVMPDIQHEKDVVFCAEKILESFGAPILVDAKPLLISCSVGIALYPQSGASVQELLALADSAMYTAKCAGKNRYALSGELLNEGSTAVHARGRSTPPLRPAGKAVDGALFVTG